MMKYLYIPTALIFMSCNDGSHNLEELATLDRDEISGIEIISGSPYIWGIEDHGNPNKLYAIEENGNIAKEISISNAGNIDWEDIASDNEGNLYIGDFGNNENDRKDLAIYKISNASLDTTVAVASSVTKFYYPGQKDFPPKKSARFYDVEAFYEHKGNFFLFTKNRSSRFDGSLTVYKVPNRPGSFAAREIGTLTTCGKYSKCAVAGADISPDGKTVVLLAADRMWLVTGFTDDDFSNASMEALDFGHNTEKEGICFKDDDTLLIADEKDNNTGGRLYSVSISGLKGEPKAK